MRFVWFLQVVSQYLSWKYLQLQHPSQRAGSSSGTMTPLAPPRDLRFEPLLCNQKEKRIKHYSMLDLSVRTMLSTHLQLFIELFLQGTTWQKIWFCLHQGIQECGFYEVIFIVLKLTTRQCLHIISKAFISDYGNPLS